MGYVSHRPFPATVSEIIRLIRTQNNRSVGIYILKRGLVVSLSFSVPLYLLVFCILFLFSLCSYLTYFNSVVAYLTLFYFTIFVLQLLHTVVISLGIHKSFLNLESCVWWMMAL